MFRLNPFFGEMRRNEVLRRIFASPCFVKTQKRKQDKARKLFEVRVGNDLITFVL